MQGRQERRPGCHSVLHGLPAFLQILTAFISCLCSALPAPSQCPPSLRYSMSPAPCPQFCPSHSIPSILSHQLFLPPHPPKPLTSSPSRQFSAFTLSLPRLPCLQSLPTCLAPTHSSFCNSKPFPKRLPYSSPHWPACRWKAGLHRACCAQTLDPCQPQLQPSLTRYSPTPQAAASSPHLYALAHALPSAWDVRVHPVDRQTLTHP